MNIKSIMSGLKRFEPVLRIFILITAVFTIVTIYNACEKKVFAEDNVSGPERALKAGNIEKESQSISAPGIVNTSATTVDIETVYGHGEVLYAVSTTDTAPAEDIYWSTDTRIACLNPNTKYYFFAKCLGDENYYPAVSTPSQTTTTGLENRKINGITVKNPAPVFTYGDAINKSDIAECNYSELSFEGDYDLILMDSSTYEIREGDSCYRISCPPVNAGEYNLVYYITGTSYYGVVRCPFTIKKADGSAPEATALAPTSLIKSNGRVTGTNDTMEYCIYNKNSGSYSEYMPVTGGEITGLKAQAKLKLRYKETANTFASPDQELTIPSFINPPVYPVYDVPAIDESSNKYQPENEAAAQKLSIPITGENIIRIEALIKDNKAIVEEITEASLERVFKKQDNAKAATKFIIDITSAQQEVNSVILTGKTLDNIAKLLADTSKSAEYFAIKLKSASLLLDEKAVKELAKTAKGDETVEILFNKFDLTELNPSQQRAIEGEEAVLSFNVRILYKDKEIQDLKGGNINVVVRFVTAPDKYVKHYFVKQILKDGSQEEFNTRYKKRRIYFSTGKLSDYVMIYDDERDNDT